MILKNLKQHIMEGMIVVWIYDGKNLRQYFGWKNYRPAININRLFSQKEIRGESQYVNRFVSVIIRNLDSF